MRCENCKYFERIMKEWGRCHRYAPRRLSGVGTGESDQNWPDVYNSDWCGEFEPAKE